MQYGTYKSFEKLSPSKHVSLSAWAFACQSADKSVYSETTAMVDIIGKGH